MAFGKPPLQTANVGGWRQRAGIRENEKRKDFGNRKSFSGTRFSNQFRPPKGASTVIRFVPGQYKVARAVQIEGGKWGLKTETLEYFETCEHFDARTKKTTICSAGALWFRKDHAQPCIGCRGYFAAPKNADNRREGRFGRRNIYVFTVLEYGPFVKVEQVDNNGLLKLNPNTGKPYTEWKRKADAYGLPVIAEKEGHLEHWAMGYGHLSIVQGYDAMIGKTCVHCNTADSIIRRALLCRKCGTDLIDCSNTAVKPDEQDKMLYEDVECTFCHHVAPLEEYLECRACNDPRRASIFDVDITVQRMDAIASKGSQLIFSSWSLPHPIDPSYNAKPLDLPAMYGPDSIERQEQWFGMTLQEAENLAAEDVTPEEERQYARDYT